MDLVGLDVVHLGPLERWVALLGINVLPGAGIIRVVMVGAVDEVVPDLPIVERLAWCGQIRLNATGVPSFSRDKST